MISRIAKRGFFTPHLTLLALLALSACGGATSPLPALTAMSLEPQAVVYPSLASQEMAVSNSAVGRACEGQSPTNSLALSGYSRYFLRADVETRLGVGVFLPYRKIATPVNEGDSRLSAPDFSRGGACGGISLWARQVQQNGKNTVLWRLEIYPIPTIEVGAAMQPWLTHGEMVVPEESGVASADIGFHAFNRDFLVHLRLTPGPVFFAEKRAEEAKKLSSSDAVNSIASPLPDELPYRTLDDVTIQR